MPKSNGFTLLDGGEKCEIVGGSFVTRAFSDYLGCSSIFLTLNVTQSSLAEALAHRSATKLKNLVRSREVPVRSFCITLDAEVAFSELP